MFNNCIGLVFNRSQKGYTKTDIKKIFSFDSFLILHFHSHHKASDKTLKKPIDPWNSVCLLHRNCRVCHVHVKLFTKLLFLWISLKKRECFNLNHSLGCLRYSIRHHYLLVILWISLKKEECFNLSHFLGCLCYSIHH